MTNEELAIAIKAGQNELMPELWEQCVKFIRCRAYKWELAWKETRYDVELDDYMQAGYIGFCEAVEKWEPGRGCSFIGFLDMRLKTAFAEVAGCRRRSQLNDAMYHSDRLESPAPGERDERKTTIADTIGGKCEELEALEDEDYRRYIAERLRGCLEALPEQQRLVLEGYYLQGKPYEKVASDIGVTTEAAHQLSRKGKQAVRESKNGQQLRRIYFGTTNQYKGTGFRAWQESGSSQPEWAVIRLDDQNRRYNLRTRGGKIAYLIKEYGFSREEAAAYIQD